jgi:type I restriction enzyme S subunit
MKRYEQYKDSGEYWLGQIPENWKILTLKKLGKLSTSSVDKKIVEGEKMISLLNYLDIYKSKNKKIDSNEGFMQVSASEQNIQSSDLLKGDVVFTPSSETIEDIGHSVVISKDLDNTLYSYHVLRLRFNKNYEISDDFKKYMFNNMFFLNQLSSKARGTTRMTLGLKDFYSSYICLPHINEQHQIASFLDHKTALIDEIITKKEKLISLLQAKRQATINEVVTGKKVWDGNTWSTPNKVKDSGVEWLGEIPEEWEVMKLKYLLTKVGSGVTPKGGGEVYSDEGVIFVRSQNVHFDGLRLDDVVRISEETHEGMSNSQVQKHDVLLNITGASIGRCCVVTIDNDINVNQHVSILRVNERISPFFLNTVIRSSIGQLQVNLKSSGGNREGLTAEAIKTFFIPLPNKLIQEETISMLNKNLNKFEELESKLLDQIQKLKSYRQSLISEAVTGKIDVSRGSIQV